MPDVEDREKLARDMRAMAQALLAMAASLDKLPTDPAPRRDIDDIAKGALARWAKKQYRERGTRSQFFNEEIFREPAWDILLDLFVAGDEGKQVGVASACIASRVPPTTALRWLTVLIEARYIERHDSPGDRRVSIVSLTPFGRDQMAAYIVKMLKADSPQSSQHSFRSPGPG